MILRSKPKPAETKPPTIGSFESFVVSKYGQTPTPEQVLAARKAYNQADDKATSFAAGDVTKLTPAGLDMAAQIAKSWQRLAISIVNVGAVAVVLHELMVSFCKAHQVFRRVHGVRFGSALMARVLLQVMGELIQLRDRIKRFACCANAAQSHGDAAFLFGRNSRHERAGRRALGSSLRAVAGLVAGQFANRVNVVIVRGELAHGVGAFAVRRLLACDE